MLGINTRSFAEDPETVEAFVEQTGVTFPVVWDDETYGRFGWPDGPSPFPRQALVDRSGVVRYLASEHREAELRAAVDEVLAED